MRACTMGMLVGGIWSTDEVVSAMQNDKGEFVRAESVCRDQVSQEEGAPFPPAAGRYHLFLAYNCPWAHRTHIALNLLGLGEAIGTSFANPRRDEEGWWYENGVDELQPKEGRLHLHQAYTMGDPAYTGRVTTPTLFDRETHRVINNESAEILRMLNGPLREFGNGGVDLYPPPFRSEIDKVNAEVYPNINNVVYRCGFAGSQEAYREAVVALFKTLDRLETRLERHRFLVGDQITEADVRLFPTLVRFDPVYVGHFKCNLRRIADYPNLSNYLRDLYQRPAFGDTVRVDLYKRGYYGNSPRLNPSGIIPLGPELHYDLPHDRETRAYTG